MFLLATHRNEAGKNVSENVISHQTSSQKQLLGLVITGELEDPQNTCEELRLSCSFKGHMTDHQTVFITCPTVTMAPLLAAIEAPENSFLIPSVRKGGSS